MAAARGAGYGPDRCARFIGVRFRLEELPEHGVWAVRTEDACLGDDCPNGAPNRISVIERQLELLLPIPIWAERSADAQWTQPLLRVSSRRIRRHNQRRRHARAIASIGAPP
jgi:hypothetical protein